MSSIIVYGESAKIGEKKVITKDTIPKPASFYGDSKLKAEEGINPLSDDTFKVVILRPPMIYGKGSKGNYPKLAKMATTPFAFPYINNERSMLYIEKTSVSSSYNGSMPMMQEPLSAECKIRQHQQYGEAHCQGTWKGH